MNAPRTLIGILGYDQINAQDLAGPAETFAAAVHTDRRGHVQRCYDVVVIGVSAASFVAESGLVRSEEHTSELQSLMRISYAVFCLKKNTKTQIITETD